MINALEDEIYQIISESDLEMYHQKSVYLLFSTLFVGFGLLGFKSVSHSECLLT